MDNHNNSNPDGKYTPKLVVFEDYVKPSRSVRKTVHRRNRHHEKRILNKIRNAQNFINLDD